MTRRSILIGVAAVLALALTAGLAYGIGQNGTGARGDRATHDQQLGATMVAARSHWDDHGQGHAWFEDQAFRTQMRDWMQRWTRDHSHDGYMHDDGHGWRADRSRATGTFGAGAGAAYQGHGVGGYGTPRHADPRPQMGDGYGHSGGGHSYGGHDAGGYGDDDRHGDCW